MPALIDPGKLNPQEIRDLMDRPLRSVLDDIVATEQAHPNEIYRAIREKRSIYPGNRGDRVVFHELEYVAELLGVHTLQLAKALGIPVGIRGGAGGTTQSYTSLEYASLATGTQLNTFTTEASLQVNLPDVTIPAGFWAGSEGVGRSLRARALGQTGTTGTPTFTYTARLIASLTWSAGGVGQSTAAITHASGVTLAPWAIDLDIICRSTGKGGASNATLLMQGLIQAGTAFAAGGGVYSIPNANVTLTVALDPGATQYLYFSAACSASNIANLVQMTGLKVWFDN